jgi:hypothetical protein
LILLVFTNPKVGAHLHQMPTLIDCLIFKDPSLAAPDFCFRFHLRSSPTNRFVRQQQRNEIMNVFLKLVNYFFTSFGTFLLCLATFFFKTHFASFGNDSLVCAEEKSPDVYRSFFKKQPDDNLLSHWLQHYHRRRVVSRSCSGWEGVVPTCYGHQA